MKFTAVVIVALLFCIASCASPEASRTRGGQGADVGNRGKIVRLHEGAKPFEKTPTIIPTKHPPLEGANQADELSQK
jgi:hypothetical protein